jgi:cytolysin (calcineurin-like family phosphatase)
VTLTWTATRSGGSAPFTTTLYVNNVSVGNVATYSQTYCNTNTNLLRTIPAYATVTDGTPQSATSNTVNSYIQNHKTVINPCLVGSTYVCP